MTAIEISLLVLGAVAFVASFVVPELNAEDDEKFPIDEDIVKKLIEDQVGEARYKIEDIVDETVEYAVEKTERSLEKLSNEKIMAVNEYSDTVLEEINKNHKEVMFLYDMLSDKQVDLKNTVRKAEQTKRDAKEIVETANETKKVSEPVVPAQESTFSSGLVAASVSDAEQKIVEPVVNKDVEISFEPGEDNSKNKNERILELHQAGKSNVAVAKELGLGVGEVKLVIDLFEGANE